MTDHVSEVLKLPTVESRQVETDKLDSGVQIVEDKERPSTPQITLKYGDAFLITDACGDLLASRQEMGLFWHGTRFLRTCNLYLEGRPLVMLSHHVSSMGDACQIDLTNQAFPLQNGLIIEQGAIHVSRLLELQHEQLVQTITVTNFSALTVPLTLSLKADADFCDLFEVRGLVRKEHGRQEEPDITNASLTLKYLGLDRVERHTQMQCEMPPSQIRADRVHWKLELERAQPVEIRVAIKVSEVNAERFITNVTLPSWQHLGQPELRSDDYLFNRLLTRGMNDVLMLSTMTPHGYYPYAGIPWFACPFGRDGLITCLQFLPWLPEVVRGALTFLAAHQGTKVDAFTDEEPGKILHEMRTGEMANCREIPYIPYYGTIDATPLFLILLEAYIRWTNDMELLQQLWPNVEAAARWMVEYGDKDGDGFLEYHRALDTGLANQGWKDAWDSISHGDGRLAESPIALCEVQGYAFAAYRATAYLARRVGHAQEATVWEQCAEELRVQFLQRFWWEEEGTFYLALDKDKLPCDVVSSNAGQCLWTGIVPQDYAQKVIARLMRADMYSGWGLRTLSAEAPRYNPMSYHNGSVWPHDNALVGAGFARFDGKEEVGVLLKSLYQASLFFEGMRLPELYCGFAQRSGFGPTRYPVACSPQAWAAGAPFMLVNALLGFQPDAEHQRLTLDRPTLPDWLQSMEIRGLRLGERQLYVRLERTGDQTNVVVEAENEVAVRVLSSLGEAL
jgi:glycogen debranching enzyme